MIGHLSGTVIATIGDVTTVLCDGIGYEVRLGYVPDTSCVTWIHEHAPQDAPHELYGFKTIMDRELFRRLLEVKGVGPKVAMRIVSAKGINTNGVPVPSTLASVRGVGQKIIAAIMEHFNA